MIYSYITGINNKTFKFLFSKKELGITKKAYGISKGNYAAFFDIEQIDIYEELIKQILKNGFWNEYIIKNEEKKTNKIVFIFKDYEGEIEKYVLNNKNEKKILELCSKFAKANFKSIRKMLLDNDFYNFYSALFLDCKDITKEYVYECLKKYDFHSFVEPFLKNINNDMEKVECTNINSNKIINKYLKKEQKNIYLINDYCDEVTNGGHHQYFINSSGVLWEETLEALKEVGAKNIYDILKQATKRFNVKKTNIEINNELNEFENKQFKLFDDLDNLFYKNCGKQTNEKIKKYIENRINKFIYLNEN